MLKVITIPVTDFIQNSRILVDEESSEACVIDPGGEVEKIFSVIKELNLNISKLVMTHAHIDHIGGVAPLLRLFDDSGQKPVLYGHRVEKEMRQSILMQCEMFGVSGYENAPEPDVYSDDGDLVKIGRYEGKFLFTPGHAPGHLALYFEKLDWKSGNSQEVVRSPVLIAGDTIFESSIGRTDLPGGNFETLIDSIKSKILTLPDETAILPGHGPDTNVGREKNQNPFLQ